MSIDYICEDAFDIQKIGYSVEGQILYEEKFLQRRFEGTYEKKINGVVCFIIEDSKWIAIHNSIVKKLKSANVTYCNLYEKFCSSESANLFLGCKANFDHFPFHDSDLKEGCKITGIIKYDRSHCTQYVATLCLYECHKYEYPKTYSWGELYETLKDMEEKGDWVEDPLFRRILNLFPRLENAPFTEVQRILRTEPFTETELNRINSPCLDGLIACVPFHLTDMKKIYENSYTETYKFCLDKGMPLDNFSSILVEYGNKPILQIYLDRGGKIPHPQAFGRYANVSLFYYYIKHGVNLSVELCQLQERVRCRCLSSSYLWP